MDRATDADATAVMQRHPGGARGDVEHGVEHRPVGDRVGAVHHALGLAVRRGDGPGIEMVAADHQRCGDLARSDELVEAQPGTMAIAVADPADARR